MVSVEKQNEMILHAEIGDFSEFENAVFVPLIKYNGSGDISKKIYSLVEASGLSNSVIARKIGVNRSTLCRWISGQSGISSENFEKLKSVCSGKM